MYHLAPGQRGATNSAPTIPAQYPPPPTHGSWPPLSQAPPAPSIQPPHYSTSQYQQPLQSSYYVNHHPQPLQQSQHSVYQQHQPPFHTGYPPSQQYAPATQQASAPRPPQQTYPPTYAPPNGVTAHQAASAAPAQSCYNCGRPDHWAQDCPEPKRAVPAGTTHHQRPFKKQKTTGPVITRYAPPTVSQAPSLQRGFTHPPMGHHVFPQPVPTPAPIPTQGNGHSYWQSKQSQPVPQASRHPSQQSTPTTGPTPAPSYATQYASPVSANSPTQPLALNTTYPPTPGSRAATPRHNSYSYIPQQSSQAPVSFDANALPRSRTTPAKSQTVSSGQTQVEAKKEQVEPWLEELQELDFEIVKPSGPVIAHPANPVAQPLPSNAIEADVIGRLPIAASLPAGVSLSKYFRVLDPDKLFINVQYGDEWKEFCNDPIFSEIPSGSESVSISRLLSRRRQEMVIHAISDDERTDDVSSYGPRSPSIGHARDDRRRSRSSDYADTPDSYDLRSPIRSERSYSRSRGRSHKRRRTDSEDSYASRGQDGHRAARTAKREAGSRSRDDYYADEQEAKLAALGVSGYAKPVQPSVRRSVAPANYLDGQNSQVSVSGRSQEKPGTRRPSRFDIPPAPANEKDGHPERHPRRPSSGDVSPYAGLLNHPSAPRSLDQDSQDRCNTNGYDNHNKARRDKYHEPTPPPPQRDRYFKRPLSLHESPTDLQYSELPANGHNMTAIEKAAAALQNDFTDEISPQRTKTDLEVSRQRMFRYSSEESDGGPRRQEDERNYRQKKKQPKVAAAYSRRW